MDIIQKNTHRRQSARPQTHRTAHRKAFLDTYTRQSRGEPSMSQQVNPAETVFNTANSNINPQLDPTAPNMSISAAEQPSAAAQTQPSYTPYTPLVGSVNSSSTALPSTSATATSDQSTAYPKKDYLDVLSQRHEAALLAAPNHLETIVPDTKQPIAVMDEPRQKLEVNLRALYEDSSATTGSKKQPNKPLSYMRTVTTSALACGILAVGIFSFFARVDSTPLVAQPVGSPVIEVEVPVRQSRPRSQSQAVDGRVATDPSHPIRIVASEAGVNAPVIGLGITSDGLIDVPEAYGVVGWYNKGTIPGKPGPAVIVGHYTEGLGGAFDNLYKLKKGDLITITNGRGQNFTYKLTVKKEYHKDKVPMEKLFEKSNESRLEIITCAGKWQADNYDKRLVVTAELVR